MKKKMPFIIMIILIFIYIFFVINESNKKQVIIGGNTIVEYKNDKIKIKNSSKIDKTNNYQKYKVYDGNLFFDSYIKFYNSEFFGDIDHNIYNLSLEEIKINNYLLAYRGDINLSIAPSSTIYTIGESDKFFIKNVLSNYDLEIEDINMSKTIVDIDKDGKEEQLFIINNFDLIGSSSQTFCYVFLVDDENIIEIIKQISSISNREDIKAYEFAYAVDIDEDNKYEIVLANHYEDSNIYFDIYKFDDTRKSFDKMN